MSFEVLPGGGIREAPMTSGVPYFRGEGVEHNIINGSGGPTCMTRPILRG